MTLVAVADELVGTAERVARAQDDLAEARAELRKTIRRAVAEGIAKTKVAEAASLSDERIGQIVREK